MCQLTVEARSSGLGAPHPLSTFLWLQYITPCFQEVGANFEAVPDLQMWGPVR